MGTTHKSGGYIWDGIIEEVEEAIRVASLALAELQKKELSYMRRLELTNQISNALMTAFSGISQLNRIATGHTNEQQRQIERLEKKVQAIEGQLGK